MSAEIQPFKIQVSDVAIDSLRAKLAIATFPDEVEFSDDRNYGTSLDDIKRLVKYWKDGFDWRSQEAKLNEVPQFTTIVSIDGFGDFKMHFVHQKSSKADSIPLLFSHGWPGSFIEVLKLLPLLTNSKDGPSFHVVAPSLPNFAFSEGAKKKGFSIPQYAEAMHKVMLNLGYTKYVSQGGDWGFSVTRMLGIRYPESCLASHINSVSIKTSPSLFKSPWQYLKHAIFPYSEDEKLGLAQTGWFLTEGIGYDMLQRTKPSTIGFALTDSPVALLAWIYEKLRDWSDSYPWTDDEILTWVSVYQFSVAGPAASVRIYYESVHAEVGKVEKVREYVPGVPLGLSYFPKDLLVPPRTWGRTLGPVVFEAVHSSGGHFAAHERPDELAGDLRNMFGEGGGAYSVTKEFAKDH